MRGRPFVVAAMQSVTFHARLRRARCLVPEVFHDFYGSVSVSVPGRAQRSSDRRLRGLLGLIVMLLPPLMTSGPASLAKRSCTLPPSNAPRRRPRSATAANASLTRVDA
jgi:hypothetical protein